MAGSGQTLGEHGDTVAPQLSQGLAATGREADVPVHLVLAEETFRAGRPVRELT
jgi:hypothetical protein